MIVRLRVPIEDGLFETGEVISVPGTLGHQLVFDGKAVNAPEAADQAAPYDPGYRRAAKGLEDNDEAPPRNKMLPGPSSSIRAVEKRGRKWR